MRGTIGWMAWLGLILAAGNGIAAEPQAPPNIVLIFIDDLGYGDVGPFGNTKLKTPQLDRLAAEGMKFTSFYATPVCSMSRACLMTGCYNARVSIPGVLFPASQIGLHPDEMTLAEVAKQKGYATICIGKWHLGHREPFLPTRQGFDAYFGIPYSNDMTIDPKHVRFARNCVFRERMTEEMARAEPIRHKVPLMRGDEVVEYPADQATLTVQYTAEAVNFIREHRTDPFFVYLPHTMVHAPLAASDRFRGRSGQGLLGDAIEELDWSVGQILETLDNLQLVDKTLVIFTSDNGAAAGSSAPWRGKKGTNFEGGVREPCIMRWPGRIPAGTTCDQIAGNIDLLPTFASLLGAKLPQDRALDGHDISPLMFDPKSGPVRETHLYFAANQSLAAIRQGGWKLFLTAPGGNRRQGRAAERSEAKVPASGPILYDLASDPGEMKDVAADHPDVVTRLQAEAARLETEIRDHRRPAGEVRSDD